MRRAESNESGAAPRPESIPAGLEWRPGVYEQPQSQGIEATQSEPSAAGRHGCLETREPKNWNGGMGMGPCERTGGLEEGGELYESGGGVQLVLCQ